ncbi:MAG: UDP-3-O-(3-hydroxymyristoyl)glucosamine N-acyltransferase [Opitutales bacterium]|nr:UDP-3-O-(3-hydroxymyristoyl)glucosamine N-acyltransferase [Opitutales bacterium]
MEFRYTLEDVKSLLPEGTRSAGACGSGVFSGMAPLEAAGPEDISFLNKAANRARLEKSGAGIVLLPEGCEVLPKPGQVYFWLPNPSLGLALIAEEVERKALPRPPGGVHPSAVVDALARVDSSAHIGPLCVIEAGAVVEADAIIGAQCFIGKGAHIGRNTRLFPQVTIAHECVVGADCLLHSGVRIGGDGFGYESGKEGHRKVPQIGRVVLEDRVEIGSNSTIDRARLTETRIGTGTKIDNLVQIGHNCVVGRHCLLCSGVGIAGSAKLGDFVTLAGQAGISGHIEIGSFSQVGGQAGLGKSLPPKSLVTGTPARAFTEQRRLEGMVRRLPELFQRFRDLENRLPKDISAK